MAALVCCSEPGCPILIPSGSGRCDEHRRAAQRASRRRYDRNDYGPEWPSVRRRQLRAFPRCQCDDPGCVCGGRCNEDATVVDHITPIRFFTDRRAAHDPSNLRSLSKRCHDSKTARLDVAR